MSKLLLKGLQRKNLPPLCNFCSKNFRLLSYNCKMSSDSSSVGGDVHQREYSYFYRVLESLPKDRSLAFAYGSGVFKQEGKSWTRNSMSDFIIASNDPLEWHRKNLEKNPSHYPAMLRCCGPNVISRLQTDYGAKIYFNTLIPFEDGLIKYGVISTEHLIKDLTDWESLYVSGRLHKPVNILELDDSKPQLKQGLKSNLQSAIDIALLQLPESFKEEELYLTITQLSYLGDFRMKVGEDKNKIQNIVSAQGDLFRQLYQSRLQEMSACVHISADGTIKQDNSASYRYSQLMSLPSNISAKIGSNPQWLGNLDLEEKFTILAKDNLLHRKNLIGAAIASTVQESSTPQAIKGIVTAGPKKTIVYSLAKLKKMFKSMK